MEMISAVSGSLSPGKGTMLTIRHTPAEGTLLEGSRKGDGTWEILTGLRAMGQGNWRSFRSLGCLGLGQSRDKPAQQWKISKAAEALRAAGFEVEVDVDDTQARSFAEAEADRYQRAEDRALYHGETGRNAASRSAAAWNAEHAILEHIPPGQPRLVGHHSYARHTRDLERADSLRRRSRDEDSKTSYHADKERTAGNYQARREDVSRTLRRIEKLEADLRRTQRDIDGTPIHGSGQRPVGGQPATGEWLTRMEQVKAGIEEQIAYWREQIAAREAEGVKVWSRADFAKGDYVLSSGRWYQVERVNAKSLTVPHGNNDHLLHVVTRDKVTHANGPSQWTAKVTYDDVRGRISAAEMAGAVAGQSGAAGIG